VLAAEIEIDTPEPIIDNARTGADTLKTVGKVFLLGIAADIGEWENDNRQPRRR
jgi:hypothetical protein